MRICKSIKGNGLQCNAPAGKGSDHCFHHDKNRAEESAACRKKASEAARIKKLRQKKQSEKMALKRLRLNSLADVKRLLAETINNFRENRITVEEAKCTAYVANILIGAIKDSDLDARLRELEERIKERGVISGR